MDREKWLDRIRRLLRLAESSNVHEAATAAATAQALMARHRIDAAVLEANPFEGIVDFRDAPLESSKRLRPWKIELASVLASANGCRIYVSVRGSIDEVVLVGRADDVDAVRIVYADMVKRVESLTRRHGAGRDRAFCNGFRLGAVTTLQERLRLANDEAMRRALAGERDDDDSDTEPFPEATLALVKPALDARDDAVDRFMAETLRLRRGKSKSLRADAAGYAEGRIVGNAIAIEPRRRET